MAFVGRIYRLVVAHKWAIFSLVLLTLALYFPVIHFDFTNWDDPTYVLLNPAIRQLDWQHLQEMFRIYVSSNYHPLTLVSLSLDYASGNGSASVFHISNLLLHLCNVLGIYFLCYYLSKSAWGAFFAAIVMAIHPLHIESVAWISARKDVLYVFFYLPAIFFYVKYLQNNYAFRYLTISWLFFVAAILCKPAAVVFPLLTYILAWYYHKLSRKQLLQSIVFWLPALAIAFVTWQAQSVKAIGTLQEIGLVERVFFASYAWCWYLLKFFFPWHLSALYPFPDPSESLPFVYKIAPLGVLASLVVAYFLLRHKRKMLLFVAIYALHLLLILQFISIGNAITADRYTYFAYPFLAMVFWLLGKYYLDTPQKSALPRTAWIGGVFLLWFFVAAKMYLPAWKNSETLWNNVVTLFPDNFLVHYNRALHYSEAGNGAKALEDYNICEKINAQYGDLYVNRAKNYYFLLQNPSAAAADYVKAMQLMPQNAEAFYQYANLLQFAEKNYPKAIEIYSEALRIEPNYFDAWMNGGVAFINGTKDYATALQWFEKARAIQPANGALYYNLFTCYYALNNKSKAKESLDLSKKFSYHFPDSLYNLLR
ncbi:MAG: tetratricopeptide repeat protein [Chitinophagales bacterium]